MTEAAEKVPLVFGHRGAAGLRPENTLSSMALATELGCDAVEFDVRLTSDGRVICMHDDTLDRTTNGSGFVGERDFAYVRSLDAGEGERVPTLEEALELLAGRTQIICELKGPRVADKALREVLRRGLLEQTIFISFHPQRLLRVRKLCAEARVGILLWEPTTKLVEKAVRLRPYSVTMDYRHLNFHCADLVRDAGIKLGVYTPNTVHQKRTMIALGVDAITTDRPDLLLAYLRDEETAPPRPAGAGGAVEPAA